MKIKISWLLALFLFYGCGILPHYEEKFNASETYEFNNVTLDQIWITSLDVIVQMEFAVTNTDRAGGTIFSTKEQRPGVTNQQQLNHSMSIIMREVEGQIIVTCQVRSFGVGLDPVKVIKDFFDMLSKKL